MPFTFSHPAIVLPLTYLPKQWISLTGLMIGSLVPDFEYFIRMRVYSIYSHTGKGIFYFDLPLALILAFVFHFLVRDKLIDNLPLFINRRFEKYKNFNWKDHFKRFYLSITISIIIGSFSHILWDSFTHEHGFFVEKYSFLSQEINVRSSSFPIYKLLQHSSSLLGLLIIVIVIYQIPVNYSVTTRSAAFAFWPKVITIAFIVMVIKFALELTFNQVGNLIVSGVSSVLIGLILASIITNSVKQSSHPQPLSFRRRK